MTGLSIDQPPRRATGNITTPATNGRYEPNGVRFSVRGIIVEMTEIFAPSSSGMNRAWRLFERYYRKATNPDSLRTRPDTGQLKSAPKAAASCSFRLFRMTRNQAPGRAW